MLKLGKKMESIKIQEIKNIVGKVGGYLTDKEGELLYSLAKNCKGKGVIVEIGSYKGKSTIWLSRGSKAGNKIKVYAIDPHRGSPELREKIQGKIWSYEEFKNNIEKAKVSDIIIPIITTSEEAAKYFEEPVELIFIDGNHSYDHIRLDFKLWFPKVVDCGFMAFHGTI